MERYETKGEVSINNQSTLFIRLIDTFITNDRGFSFERNCVLCRWEIETVK